MADSKWSRQFPQVDSTASMDAYYFVRRVDRNDVVIMGFSMGKAWLNGVSYEPSEMRSHLFLGPLLPDRFERYAAMHDAAKNAVALIELGQYQTAIARLNEAIAKD